MVGRLGGWDKAPDFELEKRTETEIDNLWFQPEFSHYWSENDNQENNISNFSTLAFSSNQNLRFLINHTIYVNLLVCNHLTYTYVKKWCLYGPPSGNDLLCKVHNPLKRLFGHEKNRQSADYWSRYRFFKDVCQKLKKWKKKSENFSEIFLIFSLFFWSLEKSVSASVIGRLPIFFMTKQSF